MGALLPISAPEVPRPQMLAPQQFNEHREVKFSVSYVYKKFRETGKKRVDGQSAVKGGGGGAGTERTQTIHLKIPRT